MIKTLLIIIIGLFQNNPKPKNDLRPKKPKHILNFQKETYLIITLIIGIIIFVTISYYIWITGALDSTNYYYRLTNTS